MHLYQYNIKRKQMVRGGSGWVGWASEGIIQALAFYAKTEMK
jgi:hypothetical protein